jgi:hypothetical protein
MTLDLSHLASAVKEQAFQDAKVRIHLAQTARWVGLSRAQMAVDELERRYQYPTCARMPCMLLYGDSRSSGNVEPLIAALADHDPADASACASSSVRSNRAYGDLRIETVSGGGYIV